MPAFFLRNSSTFYTTPNAFKKSILQIFLKFGMTHVRAHSWPLGFHTSPLKMSHPGFGIVLSEKSIHALQKQERAFTFCANPEVRCEIQ